VSDPDRHKLHAQFVLGNIAMPHVSHAPADHYNPERSAVTDLNIRLVALRESTPILRRVAAGAHLGVISACAALIAYLPARALGLGESFWSAITAIAVVQTEFRATQSTARDQFVGAAIGGLCGIGALVALGHDLVAYSIAVVFSVIVCWALNMSSASRLAGITATIILLVPHGGSAEQMLIARVSEVGWGVCAGVSTVWLAARFPAERLLRLRERRP
jgi:uncharacterized membrane protein YccC